ncbi:MAG: Holliday junction branch migration protein RuvA [Thermodesulfobacteriota bacterium]
MIACLRGILLEKGEDRVIVDAGGVGYEVFVASSCLFELPDPEHEVFFHIATDIREDAFNLYGFLRREEKRMFNLLNSVSGIGPRLAISILGDMAPAALARLIVADDIVSLRRLHGVGKKTAERLCLELKDKMESLDFGAAIVLERPLPPPPENEITADVVSALMNLGYQRGDARAALARIQERMPGEAFAALKLEELLRLALRSLA